MSLGILAIVLAVVSVLADRGQSRSARRGYGGDRHRGLDASAHAWGDPIFRAYHNYGTSTPCNGPGRSATSRSCPRTKPSRCRRHRDEDEPRSPVTGEPRPTSGVL